MWHRGTTICHPKWVKLYLVGIQFRTLFVSIREIDEERAIHRWAGEVAQVKVLEITKGSKKMHFLLFYGRVGALDFSLQHILKRVGSNSYFIILHKGGTCWGWPNLRPIVWKRGGQNFCHPITNWDGPILGVTMQQEKNKIHVGCVEWNGGNEQMES